jgi:predicted PurR-regulated permease PerM
MLTIETIGTCITALVSLALVPFVVFFYKFIDQLQKAIQELVTEQARMGEAMRNMKWMDRFAEDQREFNEEVTEKINALNLKIELGRK